MRNATRTQIMEAGQHLLHLQLSTLLAEQLG
jgi:hypothetical protein